MFESLSNRLSKTFRKITGKSQLTEKNVKDALRDVRKALLEADVAWDVVKKFIHSVQEKALGLEIKSQFTPSQAFIQLVNDELVEILGGENSELILHPAPAVVLVAGLQGSGKTTTVGKIAKLLKERQNLKVMVTSCDIYRPAAIEQLKLLAEQIDVTFIPSSADEKPMDIANRAVSELRKNHFDVLLVDTAGRLHVDDDMMQEVSALHKSIKPTETLFVVDGMTGQDAAKTAKSFGEVLPLTGVVLTKMDGDTRGGAAFSVKHITGAPIKYLGLGEKLEALEVFHPERIASRILGMGDMLTLIEELEHKVDKEKAEKIAKKVTKGKALDFNDLKEQLQQMQSMGGLSGMMDKLPGMSGMQDAIKDKVNDKSVSHMVAVIDSMTKKERKNPNLIKGGRKKRIAMGSGTDIPTVNRLLKQHLQMQKMLKKVKGKGGMAKMLSQMQDQLPPGLF